MSTICGFGGNYDASNCGPMGTVQEWSATLDVDDVTIPPDYNGQWKMHTLGQARITGSFSGTVFTDGLVFFPGIGETWHDWMATGLLTLTAASGHTITITDALFTSARIVRPHNGVATISADFRSSGGAIAVSAWS